MPSASGICIADIDKDGDLDVAATAREATGSEADVAWFENGGGGQNWTRHDISSTPVGARTLQIGDLDGDSFLDIVANGNPANKLVWYRNPGDGIK